MEFWLAQTLNGLSFGALLFLLASGLSLIFGLMRIVNIAHGSYYLLGAYIALSVVKATHSFILALLAAAAGVAAIGFIMQRVFLARFYRQTLAQVLLTMGFSFVFADVTLLVWGGDPQRLSTPALLARSVAIGPVYFPARRRGRSGDGPGAGDRCRPPAHGHVRARGCLSGSRRRDGRSVSRSLSRGR